MNHRNQRLTRILSLAALGLSALVWPAAVRGAGLPQDPQPDPQATPQGSATQTREPTPPRRIPRQQAANSAALDGMIREKTSETESRAVPGAQVTLRNVQSGEIYPGQGSSDGAFRILPLPPGRYQVKFEAQGYAPFVVNGLELNANEVLTLEVTMAAWANMEFRSRLPRPPELGPALTPEPVPTLGTYHVFRHRLDTDPNYIGELAPDVLPPVADLYNQVPNRWALQQPDYRRYPQPGEYMYTRSRWIDPFNRNKLKGDQPIWPEVLGPQTFLNFTASSELLFDGRRIPTPSDVSAARAGSEGVFGRGEAAITDETIRFTVDLFHGDASFRPIDWRIRITPEVSINDLFVREVGVVCPDVRCGTNRFDNHAGLQEAFAEVKLKDLSPNFDFVSVRAGIQQFNADFRGFLFVDEEPGARIFGNLHSDRLEYNAAYFYFLEKDTNSELNTLHKRHQEVVLGNLYVQDFLFPGYTAEFIGAWNKDDATIHFDDNGFLVRPEPVGGVVNQQPGIGAVPHGIRVGYAGFLGSGHIKRFNLTNVFYQALGEDTFNPIARRRVTVNAQMAAVELSLDRDWIRYRLSAFYSSGDKNLGHGNARGFDAIVDLPSFAGGIFSFWNREGIALTNTAVLLKPPGSLFPSLRSNKEEGQANFVNPGIFIANAGVDIDVTPKLKGFVNFNFLQFIRTEPLAAITFQNPIRRTIGEDFGLGVVYRPPLTDNIILTAGAAMLQPGQGFRDIYGGHTMFSLFGQVKFTF
jgi:Carboxypeptidase regulatory-like domain